MAVPLSIIILTYNEEKNITQCLDNVLGWAQRVIVVDSMSSDRTLEIANQMGADAYTHAFKDYADQRNWALQNCDVKTEWVLFLDADEALSDDLKNLIEQKLPGVDSFIDGIEVKRRFYWMGRWIKYGAMYPVWLLRLARTEKAHWDARSVNEHMVVEGAVERWETDILHIDCKGVHDWIEKHNQHATLEARELFQNIHQRKQDDFVDFNGSGAQKKRWIRQKIWNRLPIFIRPFLYFFYRYIIRLGFLDGGPGLIYHYLHAFWYRFLIDVKYVELRRKEKENL